MKKKQKQQQPRPPALDRQIEKHNAAVFAEIRKESERAARAADSREAA